MVRHNNAIPTGHFHKDWKRFIRTNFDKSFRKLRRKLRRERRARKLAPRPIDGLRPLVHCPTNRYHLKMRLGRGFSLTEIKSAKLNVKYARSIGIKVDCRRRNRSQENLLANKQRLKVYLNKMILFPLGNKKSPEEVQVKKLIEEVNEKPAVKKCEKPRVITEEEKKFSAFLALREARGQMRKLRNQRKKKGNQVADENK